MHAHASTTAVAGAPFTAAATGCVGRLIEIQALLQDCHQVVSNTQSCAKGGKNLTVNDLFFPDPVLVVDEAVPLDAVAQPDQVLAHLLEALLWDNALRALWLLPGLHHFLLALEDGQPGVVEVVPQLDPPAVQVLVVRGEA
jgi:hypothetical protein